MRLKSRMAIFQVILKKETNNLQAQIILSYFFFINIMGNQITGNGYITSLTFFTGNGIIKGILGTYSSGDNSRQFVPGFNQNTTTSQKIDFPNGFNKLEYWVNAGHVSNIKFYLDNQLIGTYPNVEPTGLPTNTLIVQPDELVKDITVHMKDTGLASFELLSAIKRNPVSADPQTIITHIVPVDTTPEPSIDVRMMLYHLIIAVISVMLGVVIGRYTAKCEQKTVVYPANTAITVRQA